MDIFGLLAENFDLPILHWIADNLHCEFLDFLMPIITLFGEAGIFWIATALVLILIPKTRRMGLGMGVALLIGLILCNLTLKPLCARIRPYDYELLHYGTEIKLLVEALHDYSFPSGHTIASFECAAVILMHNKKWGIAAMVLAVLIAFSRLYLYVHYPTDVLTSIVLGVGIAFLGNWLAQKGYDLCADRLKKKA